MRDDKMSKARREIRSTEDEKELRKLLAKREASVTVTGDFLDGLEAVLLSVVILTGSAPWKVLENSTDAMTPAEREALRVLMDMRDREDGAHE